jgi:hypothetical protein
MKGIGKQMFKTMGLTDVAPCSLIGRYFRFGKACRRPLQSRRCYSAGKGLTVSPCYVNPKSCSLVSKEGSQCNMKDKRSAPREIKRRKKLTGSMTHAWKMSRPASFRRIILGFRQSFQVTSEIPSFSSIVCNNNVNVVRDLRFPQRFC